LFCVGFYAVLVLPCFVFLAKVYDSFKIFWGALTAMALVAVFYEVSTPKTNAWKTKAGGLFLMASAKKRV
jgi:hypothetical protein